MGEIDIVSLGYGGIVLILLRDMAAVILAALMAVAAMTAQAAMAAFSCDMGGVIVASMVILMVALTAVSTVAQGNNSHFWPHSEQSQSCQGLPLLTKRTKVDLDYKGFTGMPLC